MWTWIKLGVIVAVIASIILTINHIQNQKEQIDSYRSQLESKQDTVVRIVTKDNIVYRKKAAVIESKKVLKQVLKDTTYTSINRIEPRINRIEHAHVLKLVTDSCLNELSLTVVVHRVPRSRPKLIPRFLRKKDVTTTVSTSNKSVKITNIDTIVR